MGIKIDLNHDKKEAYFFNFGDLSESERDNIIEMVKENPLIAVHTQMTPEELLLDVEDINGGDSVNMSTFRTTVKTLENVGYKLIRVSPLPDGDETETLLKSLINHIKSTPIESTPGNIESYMVQEGGEIWLIMATKGSLEEELGMSVQQHLRVLHATELYDNAHNTCYMGGEGTPIGTEMAESCTILHAKMCRLHKIDKMYIEDAVANAETVYLIDLITKENSNENE